MKAIRRPFHTNKRTTTTSSIHRQRMRRNQHRKVLWRQRSYSVYCTTLEQEKQIKADAEKAELDSLS